MSLPCHPALTTARALGFQNLQMLSIEKHVIEKHVLLTEKHVFPQRVLYALSSVLPSYPEACLISRVLHLSGFFRGLCSPCFGTERRLATKDAISEAWVSGMERKFGTPESGSGKLFCRTAVTHSPPTA